MKYIIASILLPLNLGQVRGEEIFKGDEYTIVNKKLADSGHVLSSPDKIDQENGDFNIDGFSMYAYSKNGNRIIIRVGTDGKVDGIKMILKDNKGNVTFSHVVNRCVFSDK